MQKEKGARPPTLSPVSSGRPVRGVSTPNVYQRLYGNTKRSEITKSDLNTDATHTRQRAVQKSAQSTVTTSVSPTGRSRSQGHGTPMVIRTIPTSASPQVSVERDTIQAFQAEAQNLAEQHQNSIQNLANETRAILMPEIEVQLSATRSAMMSIANDISEHYQTLEKEVEAQKLRLQTLENRKPRLCGIYVAALALAVGIVGLGVQLHLNDLL